MSDKSLSDIIADTMSELDPPADNQDDTEVLTENPGFEDESKSEDELDDEILEDSDEEAVEDDSEDDTTEDKSDAGETYTVKVDGEKLQVTLDELKSGYQRQADYTRDKQALKAQVEEFETTREQFAEQVGALEELDAAWDENPIGVLGHFAVNTGNPTQAVALLVRELAASGQLEPQFLEMFGITPEIQQNWAREQELTSLRNQNQKVTSTADKQLEEAQMELEIQKAIAEYDRQIDDIIDSEDMELTTKQRAAFRQELATYAADNELTNLKAAYKAFKYEQAQTAAKLAEKTVKRAEAKKATKVVSKSGAGEGSPVTPGDLQSIIKQAMKEASA